jgi:hypothetical protein
MSLKLLNLPDETTLLQYWVGGPTPPKAPPTSFGPDSLFNVVLSQARNATSGKTGISHKSDFQAGFALFHHYFVYLLF